MNYELLHLKEKKREVEKSISKELRSFTRLQNDNYVLENLRRKRDEIKDDIVKLRKSQV